MDIDTPLSPFGPAACNTSSTHELSTNELAAASIAAYAPILRLFDNF